MSDKTSKKIMILNTKGGASKSTVAFQVAAASFLAKNEPIILVEFDDENKDSENFVHSKINTKQIKVGDGTDIDSVLRDTLLTNTNENIIVDVGGNRTTTIIIEGLKATRLFKSTSLFIIPMSGGSQDLKNAEKTYDMIKDFDVPILFGLSRVRNPKRINFQYGDFFQKFPNHDYFLLTESDVIDLSRKQKKSIFEISKDTKTKKLYEKALDEAFDNSDNKLIISHGVLLQVYDEAESYTKEILSPAFALIHKITEKDNEQK